MQIKTIKTEKIRPNQTSIEQLLDAYFTTISEDTIIVITSKIVSLCEGNTSIKGDRSKNILAMSEADYYIDPSQNKYDVTLTIKNNQLIPSAGIDESNGDGHVIFWPKNPQVSANTAREYLCKKFPNTHIGVIITDSRTTPLRWGTTGTSIAHSGFSALNDFIGKPDVFGKPLTMTKVNVADALATAAVVVMGESNEQTPLAYITDVPFVEFQDRNPTPTELGSLSIAIEDDIYAPLLTSVEWKKKRSS